MSFNINSTNQPIIQAAQKSQDGGAGNLGYMKGGGKGNSNHKEEISNSIFDDQPDTFVKEDEEKPTFDSYIDRIILMFQLIFKKIFGRR